MTSQPPDNFDYGGPRGAAAIIALVSATAIAARRSLNDEHPGFVRITAASSEAADRALRLAAVGEPTEETVTALCAGMPRRGRRRTLLRAAALIRSRLDLRENREASRANRLLRAAALEAPPEPPGAAEAAFHDQLAPIRETPLREAFDWIQQLDPRVGDLVAAIEARPRSPEVDALVGADLQSLRRWWRPNDGEALAALIGKTSGASDPVLASGTAWGAVTYYCWAKLGLIDDSILDQPLSRPEG